MLWTAFLLGFFGSFHCLGMCAPIVFALQKKQHPVVFKLLYNAGRLMTYSLLGAVVGVVGNVLAFAGVQQWMTSLSGVAMILIGLFAINLDSILLKIPKVNQLFGLVSKQMGKVMQKPNAAWWLGMLNGILPCGLVYFAIFGAAATESMLAGASYMAVFGLGTLPLMLGAAFLGQVVNLKWRNTFKKMYPVLFILLGVLVLYKSINLHLVQGRAADNSVICTPY